MTANPEFKVYMKHGRLMSGYDEEILGTKESAVDKQIISSTLWTDIKGQIIEYFSGIYSS